VQFSAKKLIPATLIAGDGIGPEIVEATVMVLDALGAPFAWEAHKAGMSAMEEFGDPLPQSTLDSIRRTRLALKGPLTTPIGGGYRSSNVRLREEFQLYANVLRGQYPCGLPAHCRVCFRVRGTQWPQEGDHSAQGQHSEGA
jgi:isocitrate dehydrogenase